MAHAKEGRTHSPAGHRMSERTDEAAASYCGKKGKFVHSFRDGWRIWESWKLNWNCLCLNLNLLISAWRICSSYNLSPAMALSFGPYLPCTVVAWRVSGGWGHGDKGRRRREKCCFSFPNLVSLLNPDHAMFMSPRLCDLAHGAHGSKER